MNRLWWLNSTLWRSAWAYLRALFSIERLLREMRAMPYRGQPLILTKKGLRVVPRTSWRTRITKRGLGTMKHIILALAFVLLPLTAMAQTSTPNSKLAWDQAAPDLATANAYSYKFYPDGAAAGTVFATAVTCTGAASPFVCQVAYPAFTPGSHNVTVTASNAAGESPKSAPFTFTFVVIPSTPTNVRSQ